MRLQRMLGHIPALLQASPKSVLIVGCGAGVTAGTFTQYPSIQRIVICEIEPLIPQFVTPCFGEQNYHIVDDIAQENPRTLHTAAGDKQVEVVYDDGRHFMLTTKEKFDIITSDPIHPWVKGSAVLYTQEYFQLCKDHLNPGGMVTQWVPFYESTRATVQSELKTFFSVFPEGTLWSNDENGDGYDAVVLGEANPAPINVDEVQAAWTARITAGSRNLWPTWALHSVLDLLKTYGGSAADLEPRLLHAAINRDRDLRLQYLAGFGSNLYLEKEIYNEIKHARTYPDGLFQGSAENLADLRSVLKAKPGASDSKWQSSLGQSRKRQLKPRGHKCGDFRRHLGIGPCKHLVQPREINGPVGREYGGAFGSQWATALPIIHQVVLKPGLGHPRQRPFGAAQVIAKLEADGRAGLIAPHDKVHLVGTEPAPPRLTANLPAIADFAQGVHANNTAKFHGSARVQNPFARHPRKLTFI